MSATARLWAAVVVAALAGMACSSASAPPDAELAGIVESWPAMGEAAVTTAPVGARAATAVVSGGSGDAATSAPAHWGQSLVASNRWVAFKEAEPRWAVLDRVRMTQADTDRKGPVLWWPRLPLTSYSGEKGSTLAEYTARTVTIDLCDVLASGDIPSADSSVEYRRAYERAEQAECPVGAVVGEVVSCVVIKPDGARESCPEPEPILEGEGRWMVDDVCSPEVHGSTYRTRREALQVAERGRLRNLPFWAYPLGYWVEADALGCRGISYPDPAAPVDEVSVVADTVSVVSGTLRGLVRNWSRTLWAWDTQVHAAGRTYRWPLTIQPGETAPFEFPGWDGSADSAAVDLVVTADMSNDADLSRGFEMRTYLSPHSYWNCPEDRAHFEELAPEVWQALPPEAGCMRQMYAQGGVRGNIDSHNPKAGVSGSHPSMHGRLERGLIEDLRAYLAVLDPDGRVVGLQQLTPYNDESYAVDINGERIYDDGGEPVWLWPTITSEYPPQADRGHGIVVLFPDPEPHDPMIWIGGSHDTDA